MYDVHDFDALPGLADRILANRVRGCIVIRMSA